MIPWMQAGTRRLPRRANQPVCPPGSPHRFIKNSSTGRPALAKISGSQPPGHQRIGAQSRLKRGRRIRGPSSEHIRLGQCGFIRRPVGLIAPAVDVVGERRGLRENGGASRNCSPMTLQRESRLLQKVAHKPRGSCRAPTCGPEYS
jgi:hypothetical protein